MDDFVPWKASCRALCRSVVQENLSPEECARRPALSRGAETPPPFGHQKRRNGSLSGPWHHVFMVFRPISTTITQWRGLRTRGCGSGCTRRSALPHRCASTPDEANARAPTPRRTRPTHRLSQLPWRSAGFFFSFQSQPLRRKGGGFAPSRPIVARNVRWGRAANWVFAPAQGAASLRRSHSLARGEDFNQSQF
jgi:hypothetical protein